VNMAVVKVSYTRSRQIAKKAVRYIGHRAGRDGQRSARELFGSDGSIRRLDAYQMIDQAEKGSIFFRLAISPDPSREDEPRDLHLRQVTEETMFALGTRITNPPDWVAAVHDDHSPHRHIHVLAIVKGRLERDDLQALIERATNVCLEQRHELDAGRSTAERREQEQEEEDLEWGLLDN
jgi:hypothetical protein